MRRTFQKSHSLLGCLSAVALMVGVQASAAAAQDAPSNIASASATGQVIQSATGTPIQGVRVTLVETGESATSDENGRFTLRAASGATVTLRIDYLGVGVVEQSITLKADGAGILRIPTIALGADEDTELEDDMLELETIVVTGTVSSQGKALNVERGSDALKSVLSSNAIGQYPDRNVAEALQRVSGVAVRQTEGRGNFAAVRGIQPLLNTTTINGQRLGSSEDQGRQNRLGFLGTSNVERIEVEKVWTPDRTADQIGANINIVTKRLAGSGEDAFITGSLEYGQAALADDGLFEGELSGGGTLLDDKLGLLATLNYSKRGQQVDKLLSSAFNGDYTNAGGAFPFFFPTDLTFQQENVQSERVAFSLNADYEFDANNLIRFYGSYDELGEDRVLHTSARILGAFFPDFTLPGAGFPSFPNGDPSLITTSALSNARQGQTQDRDITTQLYMVNGEHRFGDFELEWGASYSTIKEEGRSITITARQDISCALIGVPNCIALDRTDPLLTNVVFPEVFETGFDFTQINSALLDNNLRTNDVNEDIFSGQLDLSRAFQMGDNTITVSVGARFQSTDRTKEFNQFIYDNVQDGIDNVVSPGGADVGVPVPGSNLGPFLAGFPAAVVQPELNDNFFGGRYNFGPFIDPLLGEAYSQAAVAAGGFEFLREQNSPLTNQNAKEEVFGAYFMLTGDFLDDRLRIVTGVRFEDTSIQTNNIQRLQTGGVVSFEDVSANSSYDVLLPAFIVKYEPIDNLVIRGSFTQTYARPNFADLAATVQINNDLGASNITLGNPDLQPFESDNFDVSVAYYSNPLGVIEVGYFYKSINNYIVRQISQLGAGVPFNDVAPLSPDGFNVTQPVNATNGSISGIELQLIREFDFLPEPLKGFGVQVNYTYIDSELEILRSVGASQVADTIPQPLSPEHIFNAALTYNNHNISARLAYSYQDDAFLTIRGTGDDLYQASRGQLDLTVGYQVTENIQVFFEAFNLTNEEFLRFYGDKSQPQTFSVTGQEFSGGVRFRF